MPHVVGRYRVAGLHPTAFIFEKNDGSGPNITPFAVLGRLMLERGGRMLRRCSRYKKGSDYLTKR